VFQAALHRATASYDVYTYVYTHVYIIQHRVYQLIQLVKYS